MHSPLTIRALLGATLHRTTGSAARIQAALAAHLRRRYAADRVELYASGTHALTAAIQAARMIAGQNRPVALPAFTCYDVATAAIGAESSGILLYDVDPDTLSPDWASFDAALAAGAGVVVIAPLLGFPVNWERAARAAADNDAVLVEDAAQGSGGRWGGRLLGSLGEISVLSFGRGKGWTGGGGGALLMRGNHRNASPPHGSPQGLKQGVRNAAGAGAQWLLSNPHLYAVPAAMPWLKLGETQYKEPSTPRGMPAWSAALILAGADDARHEAGVRREHAARFDTALGRNETIQRCHPAPGGSAGYLRYPLRVPCSRTRAELLQRFARDGVSHTYPTSLADLPAIRERLMNQQAFPGADLLVRELVTLPTHSYASRILGRELANWLILAR